MIRKPYNETSIWLNYLRVQIYKFGQKVLWEDSLITFKDVEKGEVQFIVKLPNVFVGNFYKTIVDVVIVNDWKGFWSSVEWNLRVSSHIHNHGWCYFILSLVR